MVNSPRAGPANGDRKHARRRARNHAEAGARRRSLPVIALLGYDGGEVVRRSLADFPLVLHCDYIPRIQEVQASIYHVLREAMERADA